MLINLHVKNFAIIDEADVDFGEHLNILTGETGAGKSILIGSLSIALGGRVSPEMIGRRGDTAMVEAVFSVADREVIDKLRELDIALDSDPEVEDAASGSVGTGATAAGQAVELVISRKITGSRSVNKINGESVPVGVIRQVSSLLIDIHGQHEHQSLLKPVKQLELVDRYGGDELEAVSGEVRDLYHKYADLKREMSEDDLSDEELKRQIDYLSYEKQEIESASLSQEEMDEIDEKYRMASNAGSVVEVLSSVYQDGTKAAFDGVSRVLPELKRISDYNPKISEYESQLLEIESLLSDVNHDISGFMQDYQFDEAQMRELEQRLDVIHGLQVKYGDTYERIMSHLSEVDEKLDHYADYEQYRVERQDRFDALKKDLTDKCAVLSDLRRQAADKLSEEISAALTDLNFARVDFGIEVRGTEHFSENGADEVEFMIATNPGEPVLPLTRVASGGELSRVMLAIKSVFAESDEIDTLIFDEIDTGISGRTAQAVAEKMSVIAGSHQVIAITHLAQIAAMADTHFVIEKEVGEDAADTHIRALSEEESEEELARILGGVSITDAVRENAREMRRLAAAKKMPQP